MTKVKILNDTSYQLFPIDDTMVEVQDNVLAEIGKTKIFVDKHGNTKSYTKLKSTVLYDELVNQKIRQRYSLSQELAILRQRDTKIEEYQAYFEFCEECKAQARVMLDI